MFTVNNGEKMMNESDKERFNKRILGEVFVWDYLKNDNGTADIGADIKITETSLYDRISQHVLQYGEDLQGMFDDEKYEYMSCFIRDVAAFRAEFENEELLAPLFNHGKGEATEFLISFPESVNHDKAESFIKVNLANRYIKKGDDNEDTFALARDVSDQLSIIVNAFDKYNAQKIIVAAAGEIQSLVQNDCSNRSD
jgi:hypothetical protein